MTSDEVRRVQEEIERLDAARVALSVEVMQGRPEAIEEDRQLEERIRELARWLVRAKRETRPDGGLE